MSQVSRSAGLDPLQKLFGKRAGDAALVEFCRSLHHLLDAGLTMVQALKQLGQSGPLALRAASKRMARAVAEGDTLYDAMEAEQPLFPALMVSLCGAGEQTGRLVEVLGELERYFELRRQLRARLRSQLIWPIVQFTIAVVVISILIMLRAVLPHIPDVTLFDLKGFTGVLSFWIALAIIIGLPILFLKYGRRAAENSSAFDALMLQVPMLGSVPRDFALSRFAAGLAMAQEAGMPILPALRVSLEATGNQAFAQSFKKAAEAIRRGESLTDALRTTALFPREFLAIMETAEVSGSVAEVMQKQAEHYFDRAARGLSFWMQVLGWIVWGSIAAMIIFAIFKLYLSIFGIYGQTMREFGL